MTAGTPPPRLADIPLAREIGKLAYRRELKSLEHRLQAIQQAYLHCGERAVIVLEGWDAAGKGGLIRRLAWALDPRSLKVWPIGPPTPGERTQHWLQRFWTRLPAAREIAVYDRSWYGRVLVERVDRLAPREAWQRAYGEICAFERMLTDEGVRLLKLFLHISEEEQRRRFESRLRKPAKRWKMSLEDLRNRARRPLYEAAVDEMLARTSTDGAPWRVVASDDKRRARLTGLALIADRLSAGLDLAPPPLDPALKRRAEADLGLDLDGS